jgi:hypothetical protein
VKLEVEMVVVYPVGIIDIQRNLDQPLPKDPGSADALTNVVENRAEID